MSQRYFLACCFVAFAFSRTATGWAQEGVAIEAPPDTGPPTADAANSPPVSPTPDPSQLVVSEQKSPATAPAPVPAAAPLTEEELQSLAGEELPTSLTADAPNLQLYGYADFTYTALLISQHNRWAQIYHPYPSFAVGNLNLYLSSDLGPSWRALSEVRFTYLPHGTERLTDGVTTKVDARALDYAEFQRPVEVGGVIIERAWLEYTVNDYLTIRGGQWLTPYGIWNVDHGSPTLIGTHRPFTVGEALFPERQTGLELYGAYSLKATKLGYHLTLSNGRGPVDSYHDFDRNKAVGGRLFLETRAIPGTLTLGTSFYKGLYTDRAQLNAVDSSSGVAVLSITRPITSQYHELSLAGDAKWEWQRLQLQSELIMNEAAYDVREQRPSLVGPYLTADYRRWGVYGLIGYQLPWLPVMPYVIVEYYNFSNRPEVPPAYGSYFGLNIRPIPRVTLKAQYTYGAFGGLGSLGFGRDPISFLELQAAWSF